MRSSAKRGAHREPFPSGRVRRGLAARTVAGRARLRAHTRLEGIVALDQVGVVACRQDLVLLLDGLLVALLHA